MLNFLLNVTLAPGDAVGFTFFIGYMSMFAATVFFFFERQTVPEKWKLSLLVSGLITMIASVHYYYMRDVYLTTGASPIQFRYIDWILTVPLMCVEFYLLTKPYGAKGSVLTKMILYSLVMLLAGYYGEAYAPTAANPGMHSIIWGVISTLGYVGIVYEIVAGDIAKLTKDSNDASLQTTIRLLRNFILVGWAIYPIGYMAMPGNLLSSIIEPKNLDLIYNIGDAINKIGFGLVVYTMAKSAGNKTANA
jgi:bacteriorhodopsin